MSHCEVRRGYTYIFSIELELFGSYYYCKYVKNTKLNLAKIGLLDYKHYSFIKYYITLTQNCFPAGIMMGCVVYVINHCTLEENLVSKTYLTKIIK